MPFTIIRNDITKMKVDAIVNAANTDLRMGGGVCGAVFKAAGASLLQKACGRLAPINSGEAVITEGFNLPAKYIIHTAGPVFVDGKHGEEEQLRDCYLNSLNLALENKCKSVAFPLISSGIYGYPKAEALHVATHTIQSFLTNHEIEVTLVVFDKDSFEVSEDLIGKVEAYIDEKYIGAHDDSRYRMSNLKFIKNAAKMYEPSQPAPFTFESKRMSAIEDFIGDLDESFSQTLLRIIDAKGKTDVEVYKRANLDRKLFSKIRSQKGYMPSKRTAIALAIALELTLDETEDLLERAGYALSHSQKFDVIIEYFIINSRYDIIEINEVLFKYDQPLLGG